MWIDEHPLLAVLVLLFLGPALVGATLGGLLGKAVRRPVSGAFRGLLGGVAGAWAGEVLLLLMLKVATGPDNPIVFIASGSVIGAVLLTAVFTINARALNSKPTNEATGQTLEDGLQKHQVESSTTTDPPGQ